MLLFCGLVVPTSFLILIGGWAVLYVHVSPEFLYSREGVTQGDPLSMYFYAIGILTLI